MSKKRFYGISYNVVEGTFNVYPDTHERELPLDGFTTAPHLGAAWCVEEKIGEAIEHLRSKMLEEADEAIENARRFREEIAKADVIVRKKR